jgi:predicted deacylase
MRPSERWRLRFIGIASAAVLALLAAGCGFASIGRSAEQRDIAVLTFGDGPRPVLLIGGLHTGPEDNTRVLAEQVATYFAANPGAVPASITLVILPSANPDGTAHGIHTNARGVDLNRNWPSADWVAEACHPTTGCTPFLGGDAPLSEPETQALFRAIETLQPEITAVWHSEAPVVEANEAPLAEQYARAYGAAAGYDYIDEWNAYDITGELIDALEQQLGLAAMDIELSACCEVTPEEFERNLNGVLALLAEVDRVANATPTPTAQPEVTPTPTRTAPDLDGFGGV